MTEISFTPEERALIDATDAALRKMTPPPPTPEAGFPYAFHHRNARSALRGVLHAKAPSRHRQIAALLLDWARANGDVRLYVYRPYAVWMEQSGHPPRGSEWDTVNDALASAGSFLDFVSSQTMET